ncbi:MAG TPA: stage II sporulation protein M [Longimicrobium sp.]|nr:stage II sporulation protein M [Longimicrobium sp.]
MAQAAAAYALNDRQVDVETPEHVSVGYELADLGSRFTATLIDWLILALVGIVLGLGLIATGAAEASTGMGIVPGGSIFVAFVGLAWWLVTWGYRVYYEGFRDGQTIGKKAMRIRVVQEGGFPVTFRAAAVRNLLRLIDMQPGFAWGVAGLSMMLHPRTKRLGDIAAGTVVVRDRTGQPIPEDRTPDAPAAVGRPVLTDQEYGALSMYVQRRATLEFAVRGQLSGTLTQRLAPRVGADPRALRMTADQFLGMVHQEETVRRRASGAGGRAGSGQATALFRRQKANWDEYHRMLDEARARGLAGMGEARVSRFAGLYREVAADLARARTYGGSPELLFMLERAVGAGHNLLYHAPERRWIGVRRWMTSGFPALVRRLWRPIAVAAVLLYLPAVITFAAVRQDPGLGRRMLGPAMMERAEEAESRQAQGKAYISADDFGGSGRMSIDLMKHNTQVTFGAFAGGLLAGVGTALMLVFNGVLVGAVTGVFANYGANLYIWSFLLVHGVIELTAICIAGGAGLWMGSALLLPGRLTRREALVRRAREAVSLIGGTALMLVVAGIFEGCVSPSGLPAELKLALAALLATGLVTYLLFAGRDETGRLVVEMAAER